jgi:glycosyltransferase involved in cell wall biosynthesis
MVRVAAVIPVLNERGAIGPTLKRLPSSVVDAAIVVDGGSTDGTPTEAEAAGAFVVPEARRGYGRACLTGAAVAREMGAEIVVFMDGDGADAVEQASQIVQPLLTRVADFVLATRTVSARKGGGREAGSMGWHQVLAGEVIGRAVGVLSGYRYSDMCAFRAIRLADLERMAMTEMTYGWNLEMQIKAARLGLRIREVPLPYYRRVAGQSKVAGNWRGSLRAGSRILSTLVRVGMAK